MEAGRTPNRDDVFRQQRRPNHRAGIWTIETINTTCVLSMRAPGFGVRDTVKGMVPDHICIVQNCVTQGCFAKASFDQGCFNQA